MPDSILNYVKACIGFTPAYTAYDTQIIMAINTILTALRQMGLKSDLIRITGATETWSDYIGNVSDLEDIKTYIALRARKIVDPPTGGVQTALDEEIEELKYRIFWMLEPETGNLLRVEDE